MQTIKWVLTFYFAQITEIQPSKYICVLLTLLRQLEKYSVINKQRVHNIYKTFSTAVQLSTSKTDAM